MLNVMSHTLWAPIAGLLDAEHLTKQEKILKQKTSMNETVLCTMSLNSTRVQCTLGWVKLLGQGWMALANSDFLGSF